MAKQDELKKSGEKTELNLTPEDIKELAENGELGPVGEKILQKKMEMEQQRLNEIPVEERFKLGDDWSPEVLKRKDAEIDAVIAEIVKDREKYLKEPEEREFSNMSMWSSEIDDPEDYRFKDKIDELTRGIYSINANEPAADAFKQSAKKRLEKALAELDDRIKKEKENPEQSQGTEEKKETKKRPKMLRRGFHKPR